MKFVRETQYLIIVYRKNDGCFVENDDFQSFFNHFSIIFNHFQSFSCEYGRLTQVLPGLADAFAHEHL